MTVKALLEDVFLRKKPVHVIMSLASCNPKYVSILSKETDCTYSYTDKLLETLKDLGLVEFQKRGRIKYVTLTPDGREIAETFTAVLRMFSKVKQKK